MQFVLIICLNFGLQTSDNGSKLVVDSMVETIILQDQFKLKHELDISEKYLKGLEREKAKIGPALFFYNFKKVYKK